MSLIASDHVAARALRFACVGCASGLVYAAVTAVLVRGLSVAPVPASIAGYCAAVPLGFVGHRGFSFRSHGHWTQEAARFAVAQALNILVTAAVMHVATATLHASYLWGMAGAVVLVPVANFLLLHLWVFGSGARR